LRSPFIFNLWTVSTAHRRSFLSLSDVVGCGRKVTERVKKTTSVPETKKKKELPMKLLADPKIPQTDEILEDQTTPTSLSTLLPRWG
jgi:hypothetical protein